MARTTTGTDDETDLDPSLRSSAPPNTGGGDGGGDRAAADDARPDPPSRDEARLRSLEDRLDKEREDRVRAETLLQAMQRQNQGTGPVVTRPTDPTEAQYFDLFQSWMTPQLQAAGQQIERVMTNLADRNDRTEFELALVRRGVDEEELDATKTAVERIREKELQAGRYMTRENALKIHESDRGKKVGRGRRASGAEERVGDRTDNGQDTNALRERAKTNATLPNDAAARNRDQRGNANQKPDNALSIEEFEQRYPDAWL